MRRKNTPGRLDLLHGGESNKRGAPGQAPEGKGGCHPHFFSINVLFPLRSRTPAARSVRNGSGRRRYGPTLTCPLLPEIRPDVFRPAKAPTLHVKRLDIDLPDHPARHRAKSSSGAPP